MRTFEERKAEIFRRSENRIKERKRNRNRLLALCMPLCLCISILSVIYLPKTNLFSSKDGNSENIAMEEDIAIEYEYVSEFKYISLEITNNLTSLENTKKVTDKKDIENIYNVIQAAFVTDENLLQDHTDYDSPKKEKPETQAGEGADNGENYSGSSNTQNNATGILYTITFNSGDGTHITYTLNGNILTNMATKQATILSDSKLSELKKSLDLGGI